MRPILRFIVIITLFNFSLSPSFGDDLVAILNLAFENDPTLRQAKANYRVNRETVVQSRSTLLPSFGIQAATTRLTSGPTSSRYMDIPNPIQICTPILRNCKNTYFQTFLFGNI